MRMEYEQYVVAVAVVVEVVVVVKEGVVGGG
jgi:hypothetical protein